MRSEERRVGKEERYWRDWSSDVCSSDLFGVRGVISDAAGRFDWKTAFVLVDDAIDSDCGYPSSVILKDGRALTVFYATGNKQKPKSGVYCGAAVYEIGRASCRERGEILA